jgi:hypothetical protein
VIKTLIFGIILGVAGVFAALYFVPLVDQEREISIISVTQNGGNSESFHINIPSDQILLGTSATEDLVPVGMVWPNERLFDGTVAELYKLRNSRDAVVGVASRVAVSNDNVGDVIEWVLHLPARGSIYVTMAPQLVDGRRVGEMRAGTREFNDLIGEVSERWVQGGESADEFSDGRIELVSTYVSAAYLQTLQSPLDDIEGAE